MRFLWHGFMIVLLTVLTQLGGLAWLLAVLLSRRARDLLVVFAVTYAALWGAARAAAPVFDRVAIPCIAESPTRAKALSPVYCAMNRTYVTTALAARLDALAAHMNDAFPGTRTRVLDAGFPVPGMPLLPHLSHDDGKKADIAFWYEGGAWRSPIGYWAFEEPRLADPKPCAATSGPSLRWDMAAVQPLMRDLPLDEHRTATALKWLSRNLPAPAKIFIEPHLAARLGVKGGNIRFQGCRAARHDDHIHIQL